MSPGRGRTLRRSSIQARSIFIPRPTPLSDEEEAEEYLQAAQEKLAVARRQLEALREAEAGLTEEGFAEALLGDESNIHLIEGHGDALLLELSAAFDAFACAVAFRMGHPDPGRFPRHPAWADVGNLHVVEGYRRRGVAMWLLGRASD